MRMIRSGQGVTDLAAEMNPETVFVARSAQHLSVHSTTAGAQRRLALVAQGLGVTVDKLACTITELPIEV
jgi:hypothetical protein